MHRTCQLAPHSRGGAREFTILDSFGMARSPENGRRIRVKDWIGRDDREPMHERLGHQAAIKRVAVDVGKQPGAAGRHLVEVEGLNLEPRSA